MKFTQVPQNATPATTDFIIGHTAAGVDVKITIAQMAAIVSANLGSSVMKFIGANSVANGGAVLPNAWTTYNTISGSSNGGRVLVRGNAGIQDGNSGAARTGQIRVQCDGVTVGNSTIDWGNASSGQPIPVGTLESHTPSAGAHTWTFQILANTGSATILKNTQFEVVQVLP